MTIRREHGRLKRVVRPQDRDDVLAVAGCRYCGDRMGPFEVDHVVPLSRGGTNDLDNLACACISCNTQKANYLLHEWMQWRKTHGLSWPPVAQHATEPRHYHDYCRQCRDSGVQPNIFRAKQLEFTGDGYRCEFFCTQGHSWTCWYRLGRGYYTDCDCHYCVSRRLEDSA